MPSTAFAINSSRPFRQPIFSEMAPVPKAPEMFDYIAAR
jgi:hypothetical protein